MSFEDGRVTSTDTAEVRLLAPVVFMPPARLVEPPGWIPHIPFAFWIVNAIRPKRFVELGTHSGNSYAAFAQAVQRLDLDTACYAVDTWQGDQQAGFYDESVFEDWSRFHDAHYGAFSRLVRCTFDEAAERFADASIDLLHIDGLHTYEAVTHDFATWRPKLSDAAVVLFHDINVRERDFGAWRLWLEVEHEYPSFAFHHAHGLGVLAVGRHVSSDVRWLVSQKAERPEQQAVVRTYFSALGDSWARLKQSQTLPGRIAELAGSAEGARLLKQACKSQEEALDAARAQLAAVQVDLLVLQRAQGSSDTLLAASNAARQAAEARAAELEKRAMILAHELRGVDERLQSTSGLLRRRDAQVLSADLRIEAADRARRAAETKLTHLTSELGTTKSTLSLTLGRIAASERPGLPEFSRTGVLRSAVGSALRSPHPVRRLRTLAGTLRQSHIDRLRRSHLFDEQYYLDRNADVRAARTPALVHYLSHGGLEGRAPHPLFDAERYLARYPDVRATQLDPLSHFLRWGAAEGRDPHALFSTSFYVTANRGAGPVGNALEHFVTQGAFAGLNPHAAFDTVYYASQGPALPSVGGNPLVHYLLEGAAQGLDPNPLFSTRFYMETDPGLVRAGLNPLVHYLEQGWKEGRDPSPAFSTKRYLALNADVAALDLCPLVHYFMHGEAERRPR